MTIKITEEVKMKAAQRGMTVAAYIDMVLEDLPESAKVNDNYGYVLRSVDEEDEVQEEYKDYILMGDGDCPCCGTDMEESEEWCDQGYYYTALKCRNCGTIEDVYYD